MPNPPVTVSKIEILKNRNQILKNPLPFHHKYFLKYGDTFHINLGGSNNWLFTRNAETISHILRTNHKNYNKSTLQTKDLAKYVGHGLLTSNGEFWLANRRMIQPAFHKKKLEGLLKIMYNAIGNELQNLPKSQEIEVMPFMGNLAFQVVAQSLFSTDTVHSEMQRIKHITSCNQKMLIKEMRLPYLKWWFNLKGEIKKHKALSKEAKAILNNLVNERLTSGLEKDDLLDMLLAARYEDGTDMGRKQLLDEVLILFVAGHETAANALSFTLLLLAKNPAVQQKLYEEVKNVMLEPDTVAERLGDFVYTRQCLEESMRLYPPAYFFDRVSIADDNINGQSFKEGTVWLMSIFELHRHEDFWVDADLFVPERFDPVNKKAYSECYFPFGAGPRMCIGNNFAMYEMLLTIAMIVQKYKLSTSLKDIDLNPLITLKPKNTPLCFEER